MHKRNKIHHKITNHQVTITRKIPMDNNSIFKLVIDKSLIDY